MHIRFISIILLFQLICVNSFEQIKSDSTLSLNTTAKDNDWWNQFSDTLLVQLLNKAVINNTDLLNAYLNIQVAQRQVRVSQSGFYPAFTFTTDYSVQKTSMGIEGVEVRDNIGSALLSMQWELDIIGRIRNAVKAGKYALNATRADYRSMYISIMSQLAINYIYLRNYQQNYAIAQENLQSQEEIIKLTKNKFDLGLTTKLDYLEAQTLYLQTKSALPALRTDIQTQINAIGVLLGDYQDTLMNRLHTIRPILNTPEIPVAGIPAALAKRRPDVRAQELLINEKLKLLGVEKANWWPQFFVTGNIGYGSQKFKHFFEYENFTWQLTPTMTWTLFEGRSIQQKTKIAKLQLDQQVNTFNNTVLGALQEIDNAIVGYNESLKSYETLKTSLKLTQETYDLAVKLYNSGLSTYQNVLNSQTNLLNLQTSVNNAKSQSVIYLIQLYKALGGGW